MSNNSIGSNTPNFTDSQNFVPPEAFDPGTGIKTILFVLFLTAVATALIAAIGNILSIWVRLTEKNKSPNTFCVLSLSIWDLLVCVALLLFVLAIKLNAFWWASRFEVFGDVCEWFDKNLIIFSSLIFKYFLI